MLENFRANVLNGRGKKTKYRKIIVFLFCFRSPSHTDQISHFCFGEPFLKPGLNNEFNQRVAEPLKEIR